LLAYNYCNWL